MPDRWFIEIIDKKIDSNSEMSVYDSDVYFNDWSNYYLLYYNWDNCHDPL